MKKLKPLFVILTAALILFSAVCFLYPAISNAINEQYNESRIDDYNNNVDSISQEDLDDYFSVAEKYNNALAADVSTDDSKLSILSHYDEILDLDDGVMGYVEIPSINVRLPIYHGESEDVLTKGAAHLEHTSFPIGGESTHVCISAHCGYPTQKFFDDIDELENGDEIYIYVLDRTLKYTVTGTDVVEPDDSSKLEVVQGKDLLTLVTCTPYGVNSHRLLVHAERAPFEAATSDSAATVSQVTRTVPKSHQLQIIIAGLAVIAVVIVKIYFWRRKRRRFRQATEVTK
ncbi:MAG: class C sortase [Ruminococcus sp.]|nr:class C sortase [uncultured Ruminococcus sp.]MBQ4170823.1 class C sortase [Ruminococcus sp.]